MREAEVRELIRQAIREHEARVAAVWAVAAAVVLVGTWQALLVLLRGLVLEAR
jgi:hypothetical protein